MSEKSPLYLRVTTLIKNIPKGKVATYGQIAKLAGAPRTSRQVSWILHSSSKKLGLPWHRVVGSAGRISLPVELGYFEQKRRLQKEGVQFKGETIVLELFAWSPTNQALKKLLKNLPPHIPSELKS